MAGGSTLILVSGIGLAIGPTLAAASMSVFGDFALFATIGIMQAALAIFAPPHAHTGASSLEEQGAFVALNPRAGGIATPPQTLGRRRVGPGVATSLTQIHARKYRVSKSGVPSVHLRAP